MNKTEKLIRRTLSGFMAALAAMAVVGCAEEVSQLFSDSTKVEVTALFSDGSSQSLTRAADGLDNATSGFSLLTSSDDNSKVRVMVDANDGNYSSFDYSITGTTAISAPNPAPAFPSGVNSVNVYGWYPAQSLTNFSVNTNQQTPANYCLSDLMVAAGDACTRSGSSVTHASALSFTHVMSKLKVSLTLASGVTVKAVKLKRVKPTVTVTPQLTSNAVSSFNLSAASGSAGDITLLSGGSLTSASAAADKVLCGVFPPQEISSGALLEITANYNSGSDQTITYSLSAAKSFDRANEYTMNISLSGTSVTTGTVSLGDWTGASGTVNITPGGGGLTLQTSSSGSNGYVTFSNIADCLYNGSPYTPTPSVTVKINNTSVPLSSSTDFDYSYENNTAAGVATVNVTGKGLFTGTVSTTFNISACQGAALSTANVGDIICSHGKVHAATSGDLPTCSGSKLALVAYKGSAGSADTSTGSSSYTCLAIALVDVAGTHKWYTTNSGTCITGAQSSDWATATGTSDDWMKGIDNTNRLATAACGDGHVHAAAQAAVNYENTLAHPTGTSQWFLPTIRQWKLMLESIKGGGTLSTSGQDAFKAAAFADWFSARGGTNFQASGYWSSVEYLTASAWSMYFDSGSANLGSKGNTRYVRPVLAF